jgi:hypothetical protein
MDLYHIYSVIKYKYVGINDKRNALAVDRQSIGSPSTVFGSTGDSSNFFKKKKGGLFVLLDASSPAEHGKGYSTAVTPLLMEQAPFPVRINVA